MSTEGEQPKPRGGHPRFYDLLERMADLHARKNHDYAGPRDPLRNLRRCQDAGIPPWKGVIVRLSDKFDRLLTFAELEQYVVKEESVTDTFLDMAVYALLGLILFEEGQDEQKRIDRSWAEASRVGLAGG